MLANGRYKKIVASTLSEIRGCLPLVKEGILEEVPLVIRTRKVIRLTCILSSVYTGYLFDPLYS
jgi:hypothetical protein